MGSLPPIVSRPTLLTARKNRGWSPAAPSVSRAIQRALFAPAMRSALLRALRGLAIYI